MMTPSSSLSNSVAEDSISKAVLLVEKKIAKFQVGAKIA
jgi:hypothetical protein